MLQKFGVYASSVKNTIPTSRGFDFYTYANQDPFIEPGNEPDADKFNARAYRSFEALMKRAERLEKLVRLWRFTCVYVANRLCCVGPSPDMFKSQVTALKKDIGTKELDVNLSPRGPVGPVGL